MKIARESSVDWESDRASSSCTICMKKFGLLIRRHHCRACGRLVCGTCSTNKVKLDGTPDKRTVGDIDELHRVCDPCYQIVTAKEEKVSQEWRQRERKMELLSITSYLSDCLVDVFFLDGKYKTICFDDTTTAGEMALNMLPTVKLAMFEVIQDMQDENQYKYIPEDRTIYDVVTQWKDENKKYAKLVLPIYDSKMVKANSVVKRAKISESNLALYASGQSETSSDPASALKSAEERMKTLQMEACTLQLELNNANSKIETWRTIYGKTGRTKGLDFNNSRSEVEEEDKTNRQSALGNYLGGVPEQPLTPVADRTSGGSADGGGLSKRDSFSWGRLSDMRSSFFKSPSAMKVASTSDNGGGSSSSFDHMELESSRKSISDAPSSSSVITASHKVRKRLSYSIETMPIVENIDMPVIDAVRLQRQSSTASNGTAISMSEVVEALNSIVGVPFGSSVLELSFLTAHEEFLTQPEENVNNFIRTFFNHVVSIEGFVSRYDSFFESILKLLQEKSKTAFIEADFASFPNSLMTVYQMVVAMDNVYECIMEFFETLRPHLRTWLKTLFRTFSSFPITNPEALRAVFHLLWKEQLLFEDDVYAIFTHAMEDSIRKVEDGDNNIQAARGTSHAWLCTTVTECTFAVIDRYMQNIIGTFRYIIGDLLELVPKEFQAMTVFQSLSWQVWEEVIKPWYRQQATDLKFFQALSIYQFLETYGDLIIQFGVDSRRLSEKIKLKKGELYKLTCSALVNDLKELWRLCLTTGIEVTTTPSQPLMSTLSSSASSLPQEPALFVSSSLVSGTSVGSLGSNSRLSGIVSASSNVVLMKWSNDLHTFVSDVIRRLVHYVEPSQKSNIRMTVLILLFETLHDIGPQQQEYLLNLRTTESDYATKIVAYINSQIVFLSSLSDTQEQAVDRISEELSEALDQKAGLIIQQHEEFCEVALEHLARFWNSEIRRICESELFRNQWIADSKVIQLLKRTVKQQLTSFQSSLVQDLQEYALRMRMRVTGYVCEGLVHTYIECLLLNTHSLQMSIAVLARMNEDLQCLTALIEEVRMFMLGADDVHRVAPPPPPVSIERRHRGWRRGGKNPPPPPPPASSITADGDTAEPMPSHLASPHSAMRKALNFENKQTYDAILQPLTHLILAIQMDKQYLIPFVQEELYRDFGYNCIRVWCLLELWRGEKKEQIMQEYDQHLKNWRPPVETFEPRVNIHYIKNARGANLIKLNPLSALDDAR